MQCADPAGTIAMRRALCVAIANPGGLMIEQSVVQPATPADTRAAAPIDATCPERTHRTGASDSSILTFETHHRPSPIRSHTETAWPRKPLTRLDGVICVALFALALVARAPFISRGETLLHSDEAIVGLMAQDIAEGRSLPIYFYGQRYMGSLEAFVIAAISPFFDNPIHALRTGPALFLAAMVAVQYLMLTRWFGRLGALSGVSVLILSSPMFMQWSISARGAYIEILLWGSLLLWCYTEWFVAARTVARRRSNIRKAVFGALIGSGLWLNPAVMLFLVPIAVHALLNRPLDELAASPLTGKHYHRLTNALGRASLPVAAFAAVLALNLTWAVWIADHKVQSRVLLGALPKPVALLTLSAATLASAIYLKRRTSLFQTARSLVSRDAALVIGAVIGASPAIAYAVMTALTGRSLDPSLPLGFRPLWMTGETLVYFLNGIPLLFGADPRPFLQLVGVGRDTVVRPLDLMTSAWVIASNWIILGCAISAVMILVRQEHGGLERLLRLKSDRYSPTILLMGCVVCGVALYLLGGCTLDFTTIRYLIPLWAFLPGLVAAVAVNDRFPVFGRAIAVLLCGAWATGQLAMHRQLGASHPLHRVASSLVARGADPVVAEPLDAHLLSYLSRQKCRTIEFESFWPRLAHYHGLLKADKPAEYLVQTAEVDRSWDWIKGGWPGETPPETRRFLWPRLRREIQQRPESVLRRIPLPDGYELIQLSHPLPDRTIFRSTGPALVP
ncbi:MAG: hypothetical protein KF841_05335 [Phycisphaerae bacterium]|nr:hypothetical protein [Phycisphaerae bacterium]